MAQPTAAGLPEEHEEAGPRRGRRINAILAMLVVLLSISQMIMIPFAFHLSSSSSSEAASAVGIPPPSSAKRPSSARRVADKGRPPPGAAGTLGSHPVYLRDGNATPVHSSVSCVGENYRPNAWMHRSCQFRHLCFNLTTREFVLYQSPEERAMEEALQKFAFASSRMNSSVAIGGVNIKRDVDKQITNMRWFPRIVQGSLTEPYYELDPDVVWVPFHSFFGGNVGHLVWDDFLPIYTLLRMFNFMDNNDESSFRPLLTRYVGNPLEVWENPGRVFRDKRGEGRENGGLWSTCDWNEQNRHLCIKMYTKFLPLMGLRIEDLTTTNDLGFELSAGARHSDLVCSTRGAAGIGMLTDHGVKLHGWERKDYDFMHNHGRGALLYEFRNFMADNVLLEPGSMIDGRNRPKGPPYIMTIAELSSTQRRLSIVSHLKAVEKAFGDLITIQKVKFHGLSIREQVRIATTSSFYVTVCGGGAVTAMFLPRGSSAFLYYVEDGGVEKSWKTKKPALLDWDIFNNMAWIRTHWMPIKSMKNPEDIDTFIKLVRHELDIMMDEDSLK